LAAEAAAPPLARPAAWVSTSCRTRISSTGTWAAEDAAAATAAEAASEVATDGTSPTLLPAIGGAQAVGLGKASAKRSRDGSGLTLLSTSTHTPTLSADRSS